VKIHGVTRAQSSRYGPGPRPGVRPGDSVAGGR